MRLALGLFFLVMGVLLLVVRFGVPEVAAKFNMTRLLLGAAFAIVLSGWNLVRWYSATLDFYRRATPVRMPLQPNPDAPRDEEPNPDFDFGKGERPK
jgi:hypothetical protein